MSSEWYLINLASIVVLGIGAQWLSWRLRLPAILLLLACGILAGSGSEVLVQRGVLAHRFLDPDIMLGGLLLPLVSVSVAIILFEGGLTLTLAELSQAGRVIIKLVSVGALVTWVISALAAWRVLGISPQLATLFGAILVVTGPTVIGPLLRHVRPTGQVGPILKWEGIVIDPIGALLAVVVYEVIRTGDPENWAGVVVGSAAQTLLVGGGIGLAAAVVLVLLLSRFWVPDYLQSPVTLTLVVAAFAASNLVQHESGLFAVTFMGIVLANQRFVQVKHILEFKENLAILLISGLFVMLGARLRIADLAVLDWRILAFIGLLILVVRPLAVFASTIGERLSWRERAFLACMAPRGIIAAAVSSVFALRLSETGYAGWELLVPYTFAVIIGTVLVYGLLARWAASRLGLAKPGRRGFLIAGANPLAQAVAAALHEEEYPVLLVDTNRANLAAARLAGLPTFYGSILSQHVADRVELSGIGRLLALTSNEEVNSLATMQFSRLFGRADVYQLPSESRKGSRTTKVPRELQGRPLFGERMTYGFLDGFIEQGAVVKKTSLTKDFNYKQFIASQQEGVVPLFVMDEAGHIILVTADATFAPKPGQTLVSLARKPQPAPAPATT